MRRPKHQPIPQEDIDRIISACVHLSDREAAIIAGAHLEDRLGVAIKAHFVSLPQTGDAKKSVTEASLFSGYGPLSSFYAKIDIGFALGIYDTKIRTDLHIIRSIRNDFAHTFDDITFLDQSISSRCEKLVTFKYNKTHLDKLRHSQPALFLRLKYLHVCAYLSGIFDGWADAIKSVGGPRLPPPFQL